MREIRKCNVAKDGNISEFELFIIQQQSMFGFGTRLHPRHSGVLK